MYEIQYKFDLLKIYLREHSLFLSLYLDTDGAITQGSKMRFVLCVPYTDFLYI